jgi:phage anti-repressor protein
MQTLDIVNLIETNSITKLTGAQNNKLLTKVKEFFTEPEQKLFVSLFYCFLNHNSATDFVIDLDNIWKWLGFQQKYGAKRLLEKHFIIDTDYKTLYSAVNNDNDIKKHGGHNKETILLTIKTFKLFCIKAETKKGKEIQEYFVKLEEILLRTIEEESTEFKLQLEQVKLEIEKITDTNKQEIQQQVETNKKETTEKVQRDREAFLLREYGSIGAIIYIIKVKTHENGEYVIKIGESRKGVQMRYNEHKTRYGEILLLDCFLVKRSKDFENFLHSHESIRLNRVTDLSGHEHERELFLIGKHLTYKTLLHIISLNIKQFNEYNDSAVERLESENETLRNLIARQNQTPTLIHDSSIEPQHQQQPSIIDTPLLMHTQQQIQNLEKNMQQQIQSLEKTMKEIADKLTTTQIKTTTNFQEPLVTLGPRLQKINPETMTIIKVYESVAECIKEYNFRLKRPSIDKAVKENTIYQGFRWLYVERNEDPTQIQNLQQTKYTRPQNVGYIAKLNAEKTEILNVYLDRKTASRMNGYQSSSALDNPVKNQTITQDHYYMLYDNCEEDLQEEFVEKIGKDPVLYKDGIGQYDEHNNLVREFVCKYECIKQLKMSDKTLTKALDNKIPYNNHHYKYMDSKLSCL